MAIDYWSEMPESTGDYEQKGGGPVIPEGTKVLASVEEIKTQTFKDSKHESLNLKWRIEEPDGAGALPGGECPFHRSSLHPRRTAAAG